MVFFFFIFTLNFVFSVWEKVRMVSFGKPLINEPIKQLLLRKFLMPFEMEPMHSEHFVKSCCCEHFEIIPISFNCTAYIGNIHYVHFALCIVHTACKVALHPIQTNNIKLKFDYRFSIMIAINVECRSNQITILISISNENFWKSPMIIEHFNLIFMYTSNRFDFQFYSFVCFVRFTGQPITWIFIYHLNLWKVICTMLLNVDQFSKIFTNVMLCISYWTQRILFTQEILFIVIWNRVTFWSIASAGINDFIYWYIALLLHIFNIQLFVPTKSIRMDRKFWFVYFMIQTPSIDWMARYKIVTTKYHLNWNLIFFLFQC